MTVAAVVTEHARLAETWFGTAWAGGDVSIADQVFAPDFVLNGKQVGPEGPRRSVRGVHKAFSDIEVDLDLVVTDGVHVVTHYTTTARHTGTYRGVPASGNRIHVSGIVIWEVHDGLVRRDWNVFDTGEVIAQITAPHPPTGDDK
ncbi:MULTISPECIES: ester cyclase [unclassified Streptomyces]|uniref:ester cyclase n=1 Tax=unclassified Streptomyces TaxID=2593676 RepID=UPI002E19FB6E|nr:MULTISPECIES: ester cyclase [unclassified Streptomyces]